MSEEKEMRKNMRESKPGINKNSSNIKYRRKKIYDMDVAAPSEQSFSELKNVLEQKYHYDSDEAERLVSSFLQKNYFND